MLDRNLVTGSAGGPAGHDAEAEAAAGAATALHESGFGSALHTALGELRRITDDPVPVAAVASSSEAQATRPKGHSAPVPGSGPDWPSTQPRSIAALGRGAPAEWLSSLGDWWTTRWRELLPGMVVVTLVVVAFAVVLASGGRRADTSHVDTRRPIDSGPSTTIAGLFSTAAVPPGDAPPPTDVPSSNSGSSDSPKSAPGAPVTTKPSSDGPAAPSAPSKASNPSSPDTPSPTSPPPSNPPDEPTPTTAPTVPDTTTPHPTTTVVQHDPPPDPPPNEEVCNRRPGLC